MNPNQDPANCNPDLNGEIPNPIPDNIPIPEQLNLDPAEPKKLVEKEDDEDITEEKIKEEIDNIILNDIENEIMEEIKKEINDPNYSDSEDDDKDQWIAKYKDCPCCYGFVFNCKGDTCAALGQCYCKMKNDIEEEEKVEDKSSEENKKIE